MARSDEFEGTGNKPIGESVKPDEPIDPTTIGGSDGGFNPAIHVGRDKRNADGSFTRKRGRKAGSGSGGAGSSRKASNLADATATLSRTLLMLHLGISAATKTPEMALDQSEADLLAEATVNVLREFDIQPNPKAEAIIGLIVAAGTVYGPRYYLINARQKTEKAASDTRTQTYEPERDPQTGEPKFDIPAYPTTAPGSTTQI